MGNNFRSHYFSFWIFHNHSISNLREMLQFISRNLIRLNSNLKVNVAYHSFRVEWLTRHRQSYKDNCCLLPLDSNIRPQNNNAAPYCINQLVFDHIEPSYGRTDFLQNVSVHQIRPTQRTFTTSITLKFPVNELPTSAVGFGCHDLFDLLGVSMKSMSRMLFRPQGCNTTPNLNQFRMESSARANKAEGSLFLVQIFAPRNRTNSCIVCAHPQKLLDHLQNDYSIHLV